MFTSEVTEGLRKIAAPSPKQVAAIAGAVAAPAAAWIGWNRLAQDGVRALGHEAKDLVLDPTKRAVSGLVSEGWTATKISIPVAALTAAYLSSVLASPRAQAEVAEDAVINAIERESLATSMRDLAEIRKMKELDKSKLRIHDQFI